MPTYAEHLFEPLEALIAELRAGASITETEAVSLRLIVARMLLEHAGRGGAPAIVEPGAIRAEDVDRVIAEARERVMNPGSSAFAVDVARTHLTDEQLVELAKDRGLVLDVESKS